LWSRLLLLAFLKSGKKSRVTYDDGGGDGGGGIMCGELVSTHVAEQVQIRIDAQKLKF